MKALITLAALLCLTTAANAHDWYVGQRDPVTGGGCCTTKSQDGYGDCAQLILEPGVLTPDVGGFRLRLTEEQAKRINPLRTGPVDTFVPEERIQMSGDGNWHVCIPRYRLDSMKADFYCFFQPGAS